MDRNCTLKLLLTKFAEASHRIEVLCGGTIEELESQRRRPPREDWPA